MNLVLLGGGGFIGSHILEHLLRSTRAQFAVFDKDLKKLHEVRNLIPEFDSRVQLVEGNLAGSFGTVTDLIRWSDVTVDLIAYANPSMYVTNPLDVVKLNFFDNLEVVKACSAMAKHLIQFSSCEVYGVSAGRTEPFSEDKSALIMGPVGEHRWIYASAKQLLERLLHAYGLEDRLSYTIIRPFNFIGPRIDYLPVSGTLGGPRVFSHFMAALMQGGPMRLVNGGHAQRSYTYIQDAVEAFELVLKHIESVCYNQIVNIGSPANETTIRGLASLMQDLWFTLTGRASKSALEDISGERFYGKGYADCDRRIPDIGKLTALGWSPRYSLRETVKETMRYYIGADR
jgi:UDP-apiose/xylose synthase